MIFEWSVYNTVFTVFHFDQKWLLGSLMLMSSLLFLQSCLELNPFVSGASLVLRLHDLGRRIFFHIYLFFFLFFCYLSIYFFFFFILLSIYLFIFSFCYLFIYLFFLFSFVLRLHDLGPIIFYIYLSFFSFFFIIFSFIHFLPIHQFLSDLDIFAYVA